jgi:hypothetical protein
VRAIDMRHRKTALKSYLTTLRAMQLQRTRTIDVSESASETSSDSGTGSLTLRPLAPVPLDLQSRVGSRIATVTN